jgi:predicted Zn-dependent protease
MSVERVLFYNLGDTAENLQEKTLEGLEHALASNPKIGDGMKKDRKNVVNSVKGNTEDGKINAGAAINTLTKLQMNYSEAGKAPHMKLILTSDELMAPNMTALGVQSGVEAEERDVILLSSHGMMLKSTGPEPCSKGINRKERAEIRMYLLAYHETAHSRGIEHCDTAGCVHQNMVLEGDRPLANLDKVVCRYIEDGGTIEVCSKH